MGDLLVQLLDPGLDPSPLPDVARAVQQAISQQILKALQTVLSGLSGRSGAYPGSPSALEPFWWPPGAF